MSAYTTIFPILLVFLQILSSSTVSAYPEDKYQFLLSQILEPYENSYDSFLAEASEFMKFLLPAQASLYKELQSLEQGVFEEQTSGSGTQARTTSLQRNSSIGSEEEEFEALLQSKEDKSRRLSLMDFLNFFLSCKQGGVKVNVSSYEYTCDGKFAFDFMYEERQGVGCTATPVNQSMCYCPYGNYGYNCDKINSFHCDVESSGFPTVMKKGQKVEVEFRLRCGYERPDLLYEGVKTESSKVVEALEKVEFDYQLNFENLKLLQYSPLKMQLRFVDWRTMRRSVSYEVEIDEQHLLHNKTFGFNFTVDDALIQNSVGGRYTFELVSTGVSGISTEVISGIIEDAYFDEYKQNPERPKYVEKRTKGPQAVYITVAAVFVLCFYARKYWTEKQKQAQEAQEEVKQEVRVEIDQHGGRQCQDLEEDDDDGRQGQEDESTGEPDSKEHLNEMSSMMKSLEIGPESFRK